MMLVAPERAPEEVRKFACVDIVTRSLTYDSCDQGPQGTMTGLGREYCLCDFKSVTNYDGNRESSFCDIKLSHKTDRALLLNSA